MRCLTSGSDMWKLWIPIKSVSCSSHISGNKELHGNKDVVDMGGMCFDRVCYLFWFYL
ncbi:ran-binding protein 1-like protein c-like [Iris pallida]|uniref:Ran-binding protein 1-like protein c-like n=1 Tax=Iris pallida TaxID=29817 RepID=A0AAX6GEQ3_IRIPA|nr:ran-binding protein 1-like protein c-like [Iris pallida]